MRRSIFISWVSIVATASTWLYACNSSSFGSGGSTSDKGSDGRRPSETGEGLVGYLRDPEGLEYERSNGAVSIRGGSGAIAVDQGSPAGLTVCLQQAAAATVRTILQAGQQFGGDDVVTLAETKADADGGFALSVPEQQIDPSKLLSINATGQCQGGAPTTLPTDRNSVVFMDFAKEGRFASVKAAIDNEIVTTWTQSSNSPESIPEAKKTPSETVDGGKGPKTPSVTVDGGIVCLDDDPRCTLPVTFRITIQGVTLPDVINLKIKGCITETAACGSDELMIKDGDSIKLPEGEYALSFYSPNDGAAFEATVGGPNSDLDKNRVLYADLVVNGN